MDNSALHKMTNIKVTVRKPVVSNYDDIEGPYCHILLLVPLYC